MLRNFLNTTKLLKNYPLENKGIIMDTTNVDDFLEHVGVKGMKWGVRKDKNINVSKKTSRDARKDAEEFARAKMFYGQGAGTRRKLINTKVNSKSKDDPDYKKAFDYHLSKQDMSRHSDKAKSERTRIDRTDTVKKSSGFLARKFTGEMGTKAAYTAVIVGGAAFLNSPKGQQVLRKSYSSIKNLANQKRAQKIVQDYFKNM